MRQKIILLGFCIATLAGCSTIPTKADSGAPGGVEACALTSGEEIAALFTRWNDSLKTGNPKTVVDNYAERSILLPTVSSGVYLTRDEKETYFRNFLTKKPLGTVTLRQIEIGCNTAVDSGLYTFFLGATGEEVKARYTYTYKWEGGKWLITSHHSSVVPQP